MFNLVITYVRAEKELMIWSEYNISLIYIGPQITFSLLISQYRKKLLPSWVSSCHCTPGNSSRREVAFLGSRKGEVQCYELAAGSKLKRWWGAEEHDSFFAPLLHLFYFCSWVYKYGSDFALIWKCRYRHPTSIQ